MSDETYNGWKNVETWVVALWLSNDENLFNDTCDVIKGKSVCDAMNAIEEMVRECNPLIKGMYADIINHALNQVDWLAIAKSFMED